MHDNIDFDGSGFPRKNQGKGQTYELDGISHFWDLTDRCCRACLQDKQKEVNKKPLRPATV